MLVNDSLNPFIEYVRDKKCAPIGTLVAYLDDEDDVVIGMSSRCKLDRLYKKRGREMAFIRAKRYKLVENIDEKYHDSNIPPKLISRKPAQNISKRLALFIEKCKHRESFRNKKFPPWTIPFSVKYNGKQLYEKWKAKKLKTSKRENLP